MTQVFSAFANSLLFNYWNANRDPILNEFLAENIPFILSENTGYTAYSGTTYNEEDIEQQVKSILFKEHPHFKSTYSNVSFSLLLKMLNEKCIGHYSAQVSFFYQTNTDLKISLNHLKEQYLDFPNTKIVSSKNNIIEIKNLDDGSWPSSVYLKSRKVNEEHVLIFSATELFF
jgi:hypothetical protein